MSKEAMKLALEALEVATTPLAKDRQEVLRAQAALREALAEQPAQEKDWGAVGDAHIAAIKKSSKAMVEDAVVRAAHKVMAEFEAKSDERLMEPPPEFFTHCVDQPYDWSEWVCPEPKSYLFKCCDCGLVHEAEFGVVRYKSEAEREDCDMVDDPNLQAVFRMRRSEQWSPADMAHRAGGLTMEQPAQQCRTDGRCQYAIDSGAEGMGHCPKGKCVMPAQQEPVECQYGKGGYACCEGGPCKADEQNNAPRPAQQRVVKYGEALYEAVSAIYFTDSSDYLPALRSVVRCIAPDIVALLDSNPSAAWHQAEARKYDMINAAPQPAQQEPVAVALNTGTKQGVKWLKNVEHGEHLYTSPQPAQQQEPVAYWIPKAEQFCIADPSGRPFAKAWEPLYTSPPAQRTWVGLTDWEISQLWIGTSPYFNEDDFARAIEAKLRSKNEDRN